MVDLIVVGGGPAGLLTATTAAKGGLEVVVFEEHDRIGRPDHCTGILDLTGLQRLGIPTDKMPYIQNFAYGAIFHGYDHTAFRIRSKTPKAAIINRELFDQYLAKQAENVGVRIYQNIRIKPEQISRENGQWQIKGQPSISKKDSRGKVLVDAEGFVARISRVFSFHPPRPIIPAIQTIVALDEPIANPDLVHMYFDRRFAYNFFSWVVPIAPNIVKVGLASQHGSLVKRLQAFLHHLNMPRVTKDAMTAHCILTGGPISRISTDHFAVVGDAAGQVKPTTGGGVNLGGLCGIWLGQTLIQAVNAGNTKRALLADYDRKCKDMLGKEFRSMRFARRLLNRISDKSITRLLKDLEPYQSLIEEQGDIDFQSGIIDALKFKPRLLLSGIREVFKDFFRPLVPDENHFSKKVDSIES